MSYRCPQCGLPRTGNQAVGLAMPQCLCSWQFSPPAPAPQRTWVGLTDEEIDQGLLRSDYALQTAHAWRAGVVFAMTQLKEKNT